MKAVYLFFILYIPVSLPVWAESPCIDEGIARENSQERERHCDQAPQKESEQKPERVGESIERWLENKLQNSKALKSSVYSRSNNEKNSKALSLRDAIKKARSQFGGTILSAKKREEDSRIFYVIKIISDKGIVNEIEVDATVTLPESEIGESNENSND